MSINLHTPLSLRASFSFPLQSKSARREILWGAFLLLALPGVGWLLNMGHRIAFVRRMQRGQPPFPSWKEEGRAWHTVYAELLWDGGVTFLGMLWYHAPGSALLFLGRAFDSAFLLLAGGLLWLAATALVPGYMTHYCQKGDARAVFDLRLALRRVREGGAAYWHAWLIALAALAISFFGLLAFGVGFLISSVWFWQVAGFSFATVFSQRFELFSEKK